MSTDIIVNANNFETRVAFIKNNKVIKYAVERLADRGMIGNIYKGKITKVLPGMQACFVDVGLEKAAFLYIDDIVPNHNKQNKFEEVVDELSEEKPLDIEDNGNCNEKKFKDISISDLVHEGQNILVQVVKDPFGSKGARVTTQITLAGRYIVLMPTVKHIGVSRRIEDLEERERLKDILEEFQVKNSGYIARTLAEGISKTALKSDINFLEKLWKTISKNSKNANVGSLVYQDLDLVLKMVRDYFSEDIHQIVIDNKKEYKKIIKFLETYSPKLTKAVHYFQKDEAIFDFYGIENSISRAFNRKIWLKSGAYIVIDPTEALTAIDVNSGRYVGKRNLEDTILKINMEAIDEIVDQLQIRNIGGIIIIDFIDMEKESHKEKLFIALSEALKKDKAKTNILKMSELGLLQMTRQRTSGSMHAIMGSQCPYCDGKGYVKSIETMCYDILRDIERELFVSETEDNIIVNVNPEVAKAMYEKLHSVLEVYEKKHKVKINIESNEGFHVEQYEILQEAQNH